MADLPTTSSSITTRSSVDSNIILIGRILHQILGAKLPSNRQVLQVFFYNMRIAKFSSKESAKLSVNMASVFWQQARIPIREEHKCCEKLIKIYDEWNRVRKTSSKGKPHSKQGEFVGKLDDLFDIAHANALQMIPAEEDRQFLLKQREKGRPGCMAGVDLKMYAQEKRSIERKDKEEARKRRHSEMLKQSIGRYIHDFVFFLI